MTEAAVSSPAPERGKSATRARLLEAAATVIARDGYERAALSDIARTAGLTTGAVYSTFGSKWELMRAVIAARMSPLALPISAHDLAQTVESPEGRRLALLQLEIHLLALRNPELLADVTTEARAEHVQLTEQLIDLAAGGSVLPVPPARLATLLIGAVQGLQLTHLLDPGQVDGSTYEALLQLLLSGGPADAAPSSTARSSAPTRRPRTR